MLPRLKKSHIHRYTLPTPHPLSGRRWAGLRIGLLGGSFNPPHKGHMHIALAALRRYKLDAIWWMVSPQNPLKLTQSSAFNKRYIMTRRFVNHPKMVATDIETRINTRYSLETVERLQHRFTKTRFYWIAGMDNALIFHRWDGWQRLLKKIPFLFFNRPPNRMAVNNNAVRMRNGTKHYFGHRSCRILNTKSGVVWNLTGKTRNISSTALRHKKFGSFFGNNI